jgi:Flp pilus assembly protein TadD
MWLNETDKAKAAYSRAVPLLEQAVKLSPQDATLQATLGILYAKVQDRVNAQARLDAARALGPKDFDFFARTSEAYEVLGERKKAVEWLNQAVAGGYSMTSLKNDAILHKLIDDPNFHGK